MGRLTAFLITLLLALPATAGEVSGTARAVDGDTLDIGGTTVRLFGIDAPELKQTCTSRKGKVKQCGAQARQMLDTLVKRITVKCSGDGKDKDGAMVAVCFAGPFDINEQMVASGWALPIAEETKAYIRAETFARARSEGLWRGTFMPPWQWRREQGVK